jgi:tetratricopeptide (TPR) repeat protein
MNYAFMKRPVFHLVLIAVFGILVYSNTFDVPFQFDDTITIVKAPTAKKFDQSILMLRQVSYLTFALNYKLHGLEVWGFHVFNLAIHIISSMLVYSLVRLTFRTPLMVSSSLRQKAGHVALISSLLFVCHPIQTQAVTYIVQRFASLAAMFYLLSLTFYIRCRLGTDIRSSLFGAPAEASVQAGFRIKRFGISVLFYALSLVSALLAMKSKEIAFTLPLTIVMYEFIFFNGSIKTKLLYLGPLFLTLFIIPFTLMSLNTSLGEVLEHITDATRVQTEMSRLEYLFTELRVITTYVRLLLLPVGQNVDYDYPLYGSFFEPPVLLSFIFLLFIFGLGVYMLRRSSGEAAGRLAAFGIFWFFLTLSVESSIIPIVDVIFEHRIYLPSVGAFISIVVGAYLMANKLTVRWMLNAAAYISTITLIVLSVATYARNELWQSKIALWQDVIHKSPMKARGHNNLGNAYTDKGMFDKAIEQYRIASRLMPTWVDVYYNIGAAYEMNGQKDKAIDLFQYAASLKPDYERAFTSLGNIYKSKGQLDKAIEYYLRALEANPNEVSTNYNLGVSYVEKGLKDLAKQHLLRAQERDPFFPRTYHVLGDIYKTSGMTEMAIEQYEKALELDPDNAVVHNNLGLIYGPSGQIDKAIEHFEAAVELNPMLEAGHQNLGNAYLLKGMNEKAAKQYGATVEINPDNAEAYFNLHLAYKKMGLNDKAQEHLQKAIGLNPALGR